MHSLIAAFVFALPCAAKDVPAPAPVYKDAGASVEARVADLLGRMTLDEKISLLSGINGMDLPANARLGIPSLKMTDGPLGVRVETGEKTTAFPAGIVSASSFDPELLGRMAAAMGVETLALGRDMLLGPCVNIARALQGGRNFESFGEDPFLAARMAEAYVKGLQSEKVLASTKHFALNNQETQRMVVDVRADERTIHEIYLPAFLAAVRAGTWTVMASYNKLNGHYASENDFLMNQVLKKDWGFKGFVVSDWGATHSTIPAANAGLDVEMPSGDFFGGGKLQAAVKEGKVAPEIVDDKARRVLRAMIGGGAFDRKESDRPAKSVVGGPEHRALALRMAEEGIVLLKNDGVLPLDGRIKSVAVLGPSAAAYRAGGGSSQVPPTATIDALDGLRERAGKDLRILYELGVPMAGEISAVEKSWLSPPEGKGSGHGLFGEYYANRELKGAPAFTRQDANIDFDWGDGGPDKRVGVDDFSIRWTGRLRVPKDGSYELATRSDDGSRLWLDGKLIVDSWIDQAPATVSKRVELKAGRDYGLRVEYYEHAGGAMVRLGLLMTSTAEIPKAVAAAAKSDAAIIFVGTSNDLESEGTDRSSLSLPEGQDELIKAVMAVNKRVIVVNQVGSPVLMSPWLGGVGAVVQAWYPGQEGGRAIADVLLGRVNPSGKLPVTFPKREEDASSFGNYPGQKESVSYAEGLYVGYRHFDKAGIAPQFPFGHGLSYTTFAYSDLKVVLKDPLASAPDVEVSFSVANAGPRAGAEVAQLYVHDAAPKTDRPEQELKGFRRLELAPGETKRVTLSLGKDAFAFYDAASHDWKLPPGRFTLRVGSSSRDIRLSQDLELK
jgi:beta-glucosidase